MTVLLLDDDQASPKAFTRVAVNNEAWLRDFLFEHPELIPMTEIIDAPARFIPLCTEQVLPYPRENVRLDILGVTDRGRLVIIECKLIENYEIRRKVVAQIVDYAVRLRRLSYDDLTRLLKTKKGWTGDDPIYERVKDHIGGMSRCAFIDSVSRSLQTGNFELIIAGDGVHENLDAIVDHLSNRGVRLSRLEVQIWKDTAGRTLAIPSLPFVTQMIRQRVLVDRDDRPIDVDDGLEPVDIESMEAIPGALQTTRPDDFWSAFVAEAKVTLDYQGDLKPRNNCVQIRMMDGYWITCFRDSRADSVGLFFKLRGDDWKERYEELLADADALKQEIDPGLTFSIEPGKHHYIGKLVLEKSRREFNGDETAQRAWLLKMADRMISALRPRLKLAGE